MTLAGDEPPTHIELGLANCSYSSKLWWNFLCFSLIQTPVYWVKWFFAALIRIPVLLFLIKMKPPQDIDVIVFIESSLLALVTRIDVLSGERILEVTGIRLKLRTGKTEFSIVLDHQSRWVSVCRHHIELLQCALCSLACTDSPP